MIKSYIVLISLIFLVYGCNKNLSEEERKELWSKAQTTGEIINRSGTPFNSATDKKLAMDDAQNRLITGGGLFGKKASINLLGGDDNSQQASVGMGLPINPFLWRAALDITSQYPLKIADNQGGYIETDWIVDENIEQKRCLMKIQLTSAELLSTSVNTNIVCQNKSSDSWVPDTDSYLEEEKQITLKILSDASILSNSQP